jgi:hypothetical protein
MIDFRSLDRETRTVALVGRFLQLWALLETTIGNAIGAALRLNKIQEYVLTRNIGFTNKTYVLSALCSVSQLDYREQKECRLLLQAIRNFSGNRNIVAHDVFIDYERTDGVEFLLVRAKGKIDFPDMQWSVDHFEKLFLSLMDFQHAINKLETKLRHAKRPDANALAALLASIPSEPTEEPIGLGSLGRLIRPLPTDHSLETNPANPETDPETPPSPEK